MTKSANDNQASFKDYLATVHYPGPVNSKDESRLKNQSKAIFDLMKDGVFRTLAEISGILKNQFPDNNFPESSVSAQLRHFRKDEFGKHTLIRRRREHGHSGTHEYQLIVNHFN